jgi:hypothetical protein
MRPRRARSPAGRACGRSGCPGWRPAGSRPAGAQWLSMRCRGRGTARARLAAGDQQAEHQDAHGRHQPGGGHQRRVQPPPPWPGLDPLRRGHGLVTGQAGKDREQRPQGQVIVQQGPRDPVQQPLLAIARAQHGAAAAVPGCLAAALPASTARSRSAAGPPRLSPGGDIQSGGAQFATRSTAGIQDPAARAGTRRRAWPWHRRICISSWFSLEEATQNEPPARRSQGAGLASRARSPAYQRRAYRRDRPDRPPRLVRPDRPAWLVIRW